MSGEISGLELNEALISLPAHINRELAREYLIAGEICFLAAVRRQAAADKDSIGNGK